MENVGREPATVHGTLRGPGYSGRSGIGASFSLPEGQRFAELPQTMKVDYVRVFSADRP